MWVFSLLPERIKERLRVRAGAITMRERLKNLRRCGFSPKKVIDAGAYKGVWSREVRAIFRESRILMIEPQPSCSLRLEAMCRADVRLSYVRALLGSGGSSVSFVIQETNSRIIRSRAEVTCDSEIIEVPQEQLVDVAGKAGFLDCDFLKLDLQGHELHALEGAGEIFGLAEVLLIEVSFLRIGEVPLAAEVIQMASLRGYRPYDVFGFNYRPLDRALWQADVLFVRECSQLLKSRQWGL